MIEGRTGGASAAEFVARMTARARRLAAARVQARALQRRHPERHWREAGLLWPLFARD